MKSKAIEFGADSVRISGPRRTDGAYTVSFETGEYERERIADLLRIPQQTALRVRVEP